MKQAKRLVSLALAAGMTMSLVPVSAFADYTGGGISSDAVTVQTVDQQNDDLDTAVHYTVSSGTEFSSAITEINKDTSSDTKYVITLSQDITLTSTLLIRKDVIILGEDHTITTNDVSLSDTGSGTLHLGYSGYGKSLTFECGSNVNRRVLWINSTSTTNDMYNVTFQNSNASVASIAPVLIQGNTDMHNCTIKDIHNSSNGAVTIAKNATLNMYDSVIKDCTAKNGGGVEISNGTLNLFGTSRIENCSATENGGGVYVSSAFTMQDNSQIINCSAVNGGGIATSGTSTLTLNGGTISGNSATGVGGGIAIAKDGCLLYSNTPVICNNTAGKEGADICMTGNCIRGVNLPDAAAMGQDFGTSGKKITDWYNDNEDARHDPEKYWSPYYNDPVSADTVLINPKALVASYNIANEIIISNNSGEAYLDADCAGNALYGTKEGDKVYLKYTSSRNTFDEWTSDDVEIHDADKATGAWFTMPDKAVTIKVKEHHVYPTMTTDLGENVIHPNEELTFKLSITPNNDADTWAHGALHFDDPEAVEKLEYYTAVDPSDPDSEYEWVEVPVDASTGNAFFAYYDYDDATDRELLLAQDGSITECTFRVTFNKSGDYSLNAILGNRGYTPDDPDEDCIWTKITVPFTVGYTVTLPTSGLDTDSILINGEAPKKDTNGNLMAKEGDKLTFTKLADADTDFIYKLVTKNADGTTTETEIPAENGTYTVTLPAGDAAITATATAKPDPDPEPTPDPKPDPSPDPDPTPDPKPDPKPDPEPDKPASVEVSISGEFGKYGSIQNEAGETVTSAAAGDTLYLHYELADLPEDKMFKEWTVTDKDGNALTLTREADGRYSFTMPEGSITVELKLESVQVKPGEDDDKPTTPDMIPAEIASASAGGITAGVAIGAAGYVAGTQIYLTTVLPKGTAIPTSRAALAQLLWTTAGKPEPTGSALYTDVSAAETDAQKADRWCVKQGLLSDKGADTFKPGAYVTRVQVIRSWNALQKLLNK